MISNESNSNRRNVSSFSSVPLTWLIKLFGIFISFSLNVSAVIFDRIFTPGMVSGCLLVIHANVCLIVRKDPKSEPVGSTSRSFSYWDCSRTNLQRCLFILMQEKTKVLLFRGLHSTFSDTLSVSLRS